LDGDGDGDGDGGWDGDGPNGGGFGYEVSSFRYVNGFGFVIVCSFPSSVFSVNNNKSATHIQKLIIFD